MTTMPGGSSARGSQPGRGAPEERPKPGAPETVTSSDDSGPASWSEPLSLPRGTAIGRYVVLERLGRGGMGVVYAAYDFALDRKVSLKLVRGDGRPTAGDRLLAEARAMARLSHPHVLAVHDVGTFGNQVFIALEFVGGGTLREWLARGRHSDQEICELFFQAARGLAAAHRAGIIHRDFKPQNVLLGQDGRVRVTDFGLAQRSGDPSGGRSGTFGYMAPEQHLCLPTGPAADQFSFAVALYEALCGRHPFAASTPELQRERVCRGQADPPEPRLPAKLRAALQRALAADPGLRFDSIEQLLSALEGNAQQLTTASLRRPSVAVPACATVAILLAAALPAAPPPSSAPEHPTEEPRAPAAAAAPVTRSDPAQAPPSPRVPPRPTRGAPGGETPAASRGPEASAEPPVPPAAAPGATAPTPAEVASGVAWSDPPRQPMGPPEPLRDLGRLAAAALRQVEAVLEPFGVEWSRPLEAPGGAGTPLASAEAPEGMAPDPATAGPQLSVFVAVRPRAADGSAELLALQWRLALLARQRAPPPADGRSTLRSAITPLERTLELQLASDEDPVVIADTRFALAQALWEAEQDHPRAMALATEARDAYREAGELSESEPIEEWLRSKPGYGR